MVKGSSDLGHVVSTSGGFERIYWETSAVSGNMPGQKSKVEELWFKLKQWMAIERELGIKEMIRLNINHRLDFYPYGIGHTLFVLFRKAEIP